VLETVVRLVEISDEVRDTIRIRYQYILVDEHQDSSGVQNKFLEIVWGGLDEELGMTPNIFVVGDDRQLIYGFGGASIEYFQNFEKAFSNVKHITLSEELSFDAGYS
jgi:DNA helicase-2/ATP-dependent DNA helicase PcrA